MNVLAETNPSRSIAPVLRRTIEIGLSILSIFAAITVLGLTIWVTVLGLVHGGVSMISENIFGSGNQDLLGWLVFWLVISGALLLTLLLSIMAYALLAQKLTKRMVISGVIIIALGLTAAATSVSIVATQSWRVSTEAQSAVQTTKLNLPEEFSSVSSVVFDTPTKPSDANYYTAVSSIQYIVDEGAPRYELTALPKAKVVLKTEGDVAHISLNIPKDYRNNYVQPGLIIYGPALESFETNGVRVNYSNAMSQDSLSITLSESFGDVTINGAYKSVLVDGKGSLDASSSAIQKLEVRSTQALTVSAGTVRELIVTQSDVCGNMMYNSETKVSVTAVTSGAMTYNGKQLTAETYDSNCASVVVGNDDDYDYGRNE